MNDSIITGRMHPHSVCPIHDEFLDDETGLCDHCERDAALEAAEDAEDALLVAFGDCPTCGGCGVTVTLHPAWGRINCPEPEIEKVCGSCGGSGLGR